MWNRRRWIGQWACAALGSVPLGAAAETLPPQARKPATRLVMAVSNKASFCYLPITLADRLGYFSSEGLQVEWREFADVQQSVQAVAAGAAHLYSGTYNSILMLQARGQPYQSIVLQGRTPQTVLGVSQQNLGHYQQLQDLRGKKIGVNGLGTASHRMVRMLLHKAQLDAQDVTFVSLPQVEAALSAFRRGQVDAIAYTDPLVTGLEQSGVLRILADARTVRGNADVFGGAMPSGCLGAPAEFVARYPRLCQGIVNAVVHALKWLQTASPQDIIQAVPASYFQGDRALYLAAFGRVREAWSTDGLMPTDGPVTAARVLNLLDEELMPTPWDLSSTYTNEFARKAKLQFRA
ncbi:MAG: hypothetical protein RLZZ352_1010 [Pseudomonadota bacterium]